MNNNFKCRKLKFFLKIAWKKKEGRMLRRYKYFKIWRTFLNIQRRKLCIILSILLSIIFFINIQRFKPLTIIELGNCEFSLQSCKQIVQVSDICEISRSLAENRRLRRYKTLSQLKRFNLMHHRRHVSPSIIHHHPEPLHLLATREHTSLLSREAQVQVVISIKLGI